MTFLIRDHPQGMIDLTQVKESRVATKAQKQQFGIDERDHVLIVNMGEPHD